ncbi:PREDICTED: uncharacterized protein LOC108973021 [Bactrocera latifrons]|uniref:uncharacterized protein LOC108973021 n=1 Tax=Bactrocera latifrons TaxID=174628 RepID=UPI0008DD90EA|nr:PREDICTED: uncharacterized protein LOC108973021 [Bactrocera latifrons]
MISAMSAVETQYRLRKGITDIEREQKLNQFLDHLHRSRNQREYYQSWCRNIDPTAVDLSFGFAQTVHYPVSPQQPGTAYFKATKRCGVFGITHEKQKVQYNYMPDEKYDVGKGPNCVVSILHYHLETYYKDIETLVLFCDNCVGQNKNNTVLSYLQWRLARGLNKTILFNFLLTGHTKFAPDRYFGIFKSKYAVSRSMQIYYSVSRHHHLGVIIKMYRLKKSSDSEEVQSSKLLLKPIEPEMPKDIQPAGLSLERQWYIYHNLRSLISNICKVDIVAPLPKDLPSKKRKAKASEDVLKPDEEAGPSSSGSTRKKNSRKTTTKKNT